jgi:hypothetical protein
VTTNSYSALLRTGSPSHMLPLHLIAHRISGALFTSSPPPESVQVDRRRRYTHSRPMTLFSLVRQSLLPRQHPPPVLLLPLSSNSCSLLAVPAINLAENSSLSTPLTQFRTTALCARLFRRFFLFFCLSPSVLRIIVRRVRMTRVPAATTRTSTFSSPCRCRTDRSLSSFSCPLLALPLRLRPRYPRTFSPSGARFDKRIHSR